MRAVVALCLSLSFLVPRGEAIAQTKDHAPDAASSKSAHDSFKRAQERFEAKDYIAALELSRAALEATGSPNARLYVARSLQELGRLAEAYEELDRTLQDAREAGKKDPKYAATRDSAAAELASLDARVAKVIVALVGAPSDARIELNGKLVDAARYGRPIAVEPGDVVLQGKSSGASPRVKQVQVKPGETQRITLVFDEPKRSGPSPAPAPSTAPAPSPARVEPRKSGGGLRTAGYVVAGVGVIGLGVFAVTGSMARSKYSQLEGECGGKRCTDPKYSDTVDSGKQLATIANVGLIVGGAGVLAGGAMILFGGPSVEKSGAAFVSASPAGVTLRYVKRF